VVVVGACSARACRPSATLRYVSTIGAIEGNIIAAIITTQVVM
jgi:hypothetical protein